MCMASCVTMLYAAMRLYSYQCTFISLYFLLHFYTLYITTSVITHSWTFSVIYFIAYYFFTSFLCT